MNLRVVIEPPSTRVVSLDPDHVDRCFGFVRYSAIMPGVVVTLVMALISNGFVYFTYGNIGICGTVFSFDFIL